MSTKTVHLHGALGEQYGKTHELWGDNVHMLVRGLVGTLPGFEQTIRDGSWAVVAGDIDDKYLEINEELTTLNIAKYNEIHILPEIDGRGRGLGLIIGIGLLFVGGLGAFGVLGAGGGFGATAFSAFGMTVTWGNIALFGLSMTLNGIASMMAPSPKLGDIPERPDERPSYLFNGPVNVGEQGGPVPLVYGEFRTGSTTVSAGITTEEVPL